MKEKHIWAGQQKLGGKEEKKIPPETRGKKKTKNMNNKKLKQKPEEKT